MGRAPCLDEPSARRWELRGAPPGPSHSDSSPNHSKVVTSKKGEDTLLRLALGAERRQGAHTGERIAGKEAFIEHLPIAERAYRPGRRPAGTSAHGSGSCCCRSRDTTDVRRKRPLKIRLARRDHKARRSKKMKDLDLCGIGIMNRLRVLSIITGSGHMTPHLSTLASASAPRVHALRVPGM
jgi:hypothetical protein